MPITGNDEKPGPRPSAVPIDATKSDSRVAITSFMLQLIAVTGIVIGFLGLTPESVVVRVYRFALTENGLVVIGFLAGIVAWIIDLVRKIVKNRQVQVLSLLPTTPDTVAVGPAKPSPSVERAVAVATQALNQTGEQR